MLPSISSHPIVPTAKKQHPILTPMAEELGIDLVQYNLLEFEQGWDDYPSNQHQPLFNIKMVKKLHGFLT